ncbi:MAG: GNAT family N-acetyltransferase [Spirochaetaceae bacterium]|nr:GNAT family N-acetyltransferase [Spirochaetaceae bacterium]
MANDIRISIINPLTNPLWDNYVSAQKESSLYHYSYWINVISETYLYKPMCIIAENSRKKILGGIVLSIISNKLTKKKIVSMPLSDYCNILSDKKDVISRLIEYVLDYADRNRFTFVEIRTRNQSLIRGIPAFKESPIIFKNHILPLESPLEQIYMNFHKNYIKRNIVKAEKSSLVIRQISGEEDMKVFYRLHVMTRKKHGLPPQPFLFFRNIRSNLLVENCFSGLIAFDEGRPAAAIILAEYKDTLYYLYGGSDPHLLTKRPNHLLLWTAIKTAHYKGLKKFDFGRTSPENKGLLDFKRRWGTEENDIIHYQYTKNPKKQSLITRKIRTNQFTFKILRRLPAFVLRAFGFIIYRYIK